MSGDLEDGDVILIAPQTKNQDGTQTFYILDPCPPGECPDEPREIELIDLTAEVKNTGAIALLSTNTSTGALEITLTKKPKVKIEEIVSEMDTNTDQLSSSPVIVREQLEEMITDDDLANTIIKEEDEDVDVEEISLHDVNIEGSSEQKSEPESVMCEIDDENQEIPNDEDDDIEEGALYIDVDKYTDLQEELVQENPGTLKHLNDIIIKETDTVIAEKELENSVEHDTSEVIVISGENDTSQAIKNSIEEEVELTSNTIDSSQVINSTEEPISVDTDVQEAFIHGHLIKIPTGSNIISHKLTEHEYGDSTNTALTLLELAGGTSLRNTLCPVEMEVIELQANVAQPPVQFMTTDETQPISELTTLTTLQPVPLDTHDIACEQEDTNDIPCEQEDTVVNLDCNEDVKPEVSLTQKSMNNVKVSTDIVQRLIEGDTPMLGTRGPKGQFKHLSSPIVTQDEIAQEILERSIQKCPYTEPSGGDVIFAMKLAHRLATKIVPPDKSNDQLEKSTEKSQQLDTCVAVKPQNSTQLSKPDTVPKTNEVNKMSLEKSDFGKIDSDKIELLKILEDDPDEMADQSQLVIEQPKIRKSKTRASPLIKLHPELEKELALKQLQDFNQDRKRKTSFIHDVLKKSPNQEKETLRKQREHNNNFNTKSGSNQSSLPKRKLTLTSEKSVKKIKKEQSDREAVTVDPSQITETLTVEGENLVGEQWKDGKSIKQYSNKRLSRSSETPPREVPMEILLNGVDDDVNLDEKGVSKNKIFKATNPKKRQEELKRKRQKHFANVLQRNKPHKKRGRPPKKKPILTADEMLTQDFLMKTANRFNKTKNGLDETAKNSVCSEDFTRDDKVPKTKKMREIERLLGDEGAINMLYSVEQKRTTGGEPKRGMLPSYRRKKKDLILKTKLVKSAVLRLTTSPSQVPGKISLRGQSTKDEENDENTEEMSLRKMSVDSHDSHHSLSSPQGETFPFPAKIVPAEASRIIRRHSSSSNYSSRSNSPRRPSIDSERVSVTSPVVNSTEVGQGDAPMPNMKHSKQGKSVSHAAGNTVVVKKISEKTERHQEKCKETNGNQEHCQQQTTIGSKKSLTKTTVVDKCKSRVQFKSDSCVRVGPGRPRKKVSMDEVKKTVELNTSLAAAVEDFTKEIEHVDKNIPAETPKKLLSSSLPSPEANTRTSTSTKVAVYRKSMTTKPGRTRTLKSSIIYNELSLKRYNHLVEIILAPVSTKLKNALNANVLRELVTVLNGLAKDDNCRTVLITSSGSVFCQGVDFFALVQPTPEKRMAAALEMAVAIKDFIKALAMFSKPVVAGVQGPAVGLGTTMLPLFDLVFSSDQATFHTPYAKLGQVPEGAASLTFPTLLGFSATSEMLFACCKLTAAEAQHIGLVTRVLRAEKFHEELLPIMGAMASQSSQSMDATKALLRQNLLAGLETTLVSETHLLIQHWTGQECQANFNMYLQDEGESLALQKQAT